jgi:hypothetical protein
MHERDLVAEDPPPRALVDELCAGGGKPGELGRNVVDLDREVVHPRSAFRQEPADRRVGTARGQQLHAPLAEPHQHDVCALVVEPFAMLDLGAEEAPVDLDGAVEILDGDSDVVDPARRHAGDRTGGPACQDRCVARRPALLLLLALSLLAGCGGSGKKGNGEAGKTVAQIVADTRATVLAATSVHVSGSGLSSGSPLALDLRLVAGKGGKGRITANGITFDMVRVGPTAYFKAGPKFWQGFGGGTAAALLANRWLKAPATTGKLATFTPLTDIRKLFTALLDVHGNLEKTGESTIDGVPVIGIRDRTRGGTLYVATTGAPYPVALRKAGQGGIRFDSWNEPVPLKAPAKAVDLSGLGG